MSLISRDPSGEKIPEKLLSENLPVENLPIEKPLVENTPAEKVLAASWNVPFRDRQHVSHLLESIRACVTRPWNIMEVCGGQTHAILRHGIDQLLPDGIELLHGPGCPVCVTEDAIIDAACRIALMPGVILCSFGDMLRVPGSAGSLMQARSEGADVRVVYSPLDAVSLAVQMPDRQIVFLAVGFETTAPANALALQRARRAGMGNFSMLLSQVTVPPALTGLLAGEHRIDAFLAAGHVCTVMGFGQYHAIAERFRVPIAVTGFEPVDILRGVLSCVQALEAGRYGVANLYERSVSEAGNISAQAMLSEVFAPVDKIWRGIGTIPASGLYFAPAYAQFDALQRFDLPPIAATNIQSECISGDIMQGLRKPHQCPAFGKACTPEHPLGATMVSGEGACNAYYQYRNEVVDE